MTQTNSHFDVAETARVKLAEHYEFSRTDNSIRRLVLLSNMLKKAPQHTENSGQVPVPTSPVEQKMAQSWLDSCLEDLIQDDESDQPQQLLYTPVRIPLAPSDSATANMRTWVLEQVELVDEDDLPPLCSSTSSDDSIWSNDSEDEF
jgi:hypothetical protein